MEKKEVITRFAPSPTGHMHIGGLWTALFNWLWAKKNKGKFILRIEDTDQARIEKGSVESITNGLEWLGLEWDQGPVYQSERIKIYQEQAETLIKEQKAYYCFCSKDRLDKIRKRQQKNKLPTIYDGQCRDLDINAAKKRVASKEEYVIRMKVPRTGQTEFEDIIRGIVIFKNSLIDDQVIIKADGFPTYHLASVVDDYLMEIDPVIRAEEWLPSTPKHLMLYNFFGWKAPEFAHLPQILGSDRSKLSKRHGATSVQQFIDDRYLPEAMINFLALLGWNPKDDREIFSLKDLLEVFDLKKINRAGAIFNQEKLDWYNSHYIKNKDVDELVKAVQPYLSKKITEALLKKILEVEKTRLTRFDEMDKLVELYITVPKYERDLLSWKKMKNVEVAKSLELLINSLKSLEEKEWNKQKILKAAMELIQQNELKVGEVMWPFRVALSGQDKSPGPDEIAWAIGKKETIKRLDQALKLF